MSLTWPTWPGSTAICTLIPSSRSPSTGRPASSRPGAAAQPEITSLGSFPVVMNDAAACARVSDAFAAGLGPGLVLDPGPVTGSEDVGLSA